MKKQLFLLALLGIFFAPYLATAANIQPALRMLEKMS